MGQQYVAEIHTKKGDVYYYVTENLEHIAGTADWFTSEGPDAMNYVGVCTNLESIALGHHTPRALLLIRREDLSHIVYRNVRVIREQDGKHTAIPNF